MRIEQFAIPAVRFLRERPRFFAMLDRFDKWGNPFSEERRRNPYPFYEKVRKEGPVAYHPMYQEWAITGWDECQQVLRSEDTSVAALPEMLLSVTPYSKLDPVVADYWRRWLIFTDPPHHGRQRRLLAKAFSPGRIAALEPRVATIAKTLLANVEGQETPDLATAFNEPLPINVISDLVGFPESEWQRSQRVADHQAKLLDPLGGFDAEVLNREITELMEFIGELADERRADPQDDLLTALVQIEDEGERLTRDELIAHVGLLMFAGHETTTGLLGNATLALAQFPEQRELLRNNSQLWPNAIEELIRFDTSVHIDPRSITADMELGGRTIAAGKNMMLWLGAANRDPRKFDRPNELLLDREDAQSISFGHGIHFCIGAALARLEMRVGLGAILESFGDYTIDTDAVEWKDSATLRGPMFLPVKRG